MIMQIGRGVKFSRADECSRGVDRAVDRARASVYV